VSIVWLEARDVLYFHRELIREHGGLQGPADTAKLESTLARPRNLLAYRDDATIHDLAASYGYGFGRNHCFPDGNKRIALVAMDVFLMVNRQELTADEADAVVTIRQLAAGKMSEAELAAWIHANSTPG
jgi:death-on-curing protein